MNASGHFRVETKYDPVAKAAVTQQVAVCCRCGARAGVRAPHGQLLAVSKLADHFRRMGWRIASRRSDDTCKTCIAAGGARGRTAPRPARPARELTPAQKRAAWCRIEDVPRAQPAAASPVSVPPVVEPAMPADPPPTPTREQRRAIRDALDEHYLVDQGCYAKSFSDASVAEKLKVPRAWVGEERDGAYGPEGCEDDRAAGAKLSALEAHLREVAERAMKAAIEAEAAVAEVAKMRAAVAGRRAA